MGLSSGRNSQDVDRLTQEVDRAKRQIDQTMAELREVRERIGDPDRVYHALRPAGPDQRRDLASSCIALQLALRDTTRWACELADRACGRQLPPGADAA